MTIKTHIDFSATEARAKEMSLSSLRFAWEDSSMASRAAEEIELAGNPVTKTGGFYRDEASVYAAEIKRRTLPPVKRE